MSAGTGCDISTVIGDDVQKQAFVGQLRLDSRLGLGFRFAILG
ncbi:MAG TPA: hypothetical protein VKO85_12385 [Wenzhouxiangellaceae bacterium]|nr:hypothetical protein [Wenzhouxiangellaceae bacterium]